MKKQKQLFIITVLIFCISIKPFAQRYVNSFENFAREDQNSAGGNDNRQNFVKINLTAIILKNYSIQYERVLNKSISLALSYRNMPTTSIPFKHLALKAVDDDDADTKEVIEKLKISNFAFTPEVRFYLGKKGYGRGFYIAPFYRYANFKTNSLTFTYQNGVLSEGSITLSGKLTANTGGILFGAQWPLSKLICLDWWILGPHYGSGKGNFIGIPASPLTPSEQNELRNQLEDLDIPLTHTTVNVTANQASLKLDGPWGGVRAGISIGIKF